MSYVDNFMIIGSLSEEEKEKIIELIHKCMNADRKHWELQDASKMATECGKAFEAEVYLIALNYGDTERFIREFKEITKDNDFVQLFFMGEHDYKFKEVKL